MDKNLIEFYREKGSMPDWIYYQVNGKSIYENYKEQHNKIQKKYAAAIQEEKDKAALDKFITEQVESKLEKCLDKTLNELLKVFK